MLSLLDIFGVGDRSEMTVVFLRQMVVLFYFFIGLDCLGLRLNE